MNTKEAIAITHTLSKPSKMPGFAIGIPAKECKTGAKLRKIKGSVCFGCYALKGCYVLLHLLLFHYPFISPVLIKITSYTIPKPLSNLSFTYPHNHRLYRLLLEAWRLKLVTSTSG